MRLILPVLILAGVGFALWVRFVPARADQWHRAPDAAPHGDTTTMGSHTHKRAGTADDLARLDAIIRATPRTRVLAGDVAEGLITYETRSRLWRFPDYTTVHLADGDLVIHGRLRFGKGDMGVNKTRIMGWLSALDAGAAKSD